MGTVVNRNCHAVNVKPLEITTKVPLIIIPSRRFQQVKENTTQVLAVVGPYLRLELSDSSCILFSTELSSKNRFNILFGGFSW